MKTRVEVLARSMLKNMYEENHTIIQRTTVWGYNALSPKTEGTDNFAIALIKGRSRKSEDCVSEFYKQRTNRQNSSPTQSGQSTLFRLKTMASDLEVLILIPAASHWARLRTVPIGQAIPPNQSPPGHVVIVHVSVEVPQQDDGGLLEDGPMPLLRAGPGQAPWAKARPQGTCRRATSLGLAPWWGPDLV
ncbi:hypothetical protein L3Q82_006823 [Scortum barcoo]|uniref:Uncharacterized protein n=1 Tax=Scortum barcoo TaxID=214431 RepID=A0ACB8WWB1_9TELE|nr:hypothetical protein L3Q82_006823 [Scortum barcoo]